MKKQIILEIFLISAGACCFLLFIIIGSSIDDQGMLHEPFALIPIGYLFIALGLLSGIIRFLMKIFNSYHRKR